MTHAEAKTKAVVRSMFIDGMSPKEIIENINLWTEEVLSDQP